MLKLFVVHLLLGHLSIVITGISCTLSVGKLVFTLSSFASLFHKEGGQKTEERQEPVGAKFLSLSKKPPNPKNQPKGEVFGFSLSF